MASSYGGKKTNDKIVWLDMEMTGLDPDKDHILEIACVVTDKDLEKVSPVLNLVIHQPSHVLSQMDDWCTEQHSKSGLLRDSKSSSIGIDDAQLKLVKFLQSHTHPGGCPLAGNTVYMDKFFLMKHLPKVCAYLHYRIIDVSSIFEVCRRWYPDFRGIKKKLKHRAESDILESIAQLKHLRKTYFVKPPPRSLRGAVGHPPSSAHRLHHDEDEDSLSS